MGREDGWHPAEYGTQLQTLTHSQTSRRAIKSKTWKRCITHILISEINAHTITRGTYTNAHRHSYMWIIWMKV